MPIPDYELLIKQTSDKYTIPENLVKAVCQVESGMNMWAVRFEPAYKWLYNISNIQLTATETVCQKTSYGLMQVMGSVARELGFVGRFLTQLCDPETGLEYGCKHLKNFYMRYNSWEDAISSYNAGSPKKGDDGKYINQAYVDKVKMYWDNPA